MLPLSDQNFPESFSFGVDKINMPADLDNLAGESDTLSSEVLEFEFAFEIDSEIPLNSHLITP